MRFDEPLDRLAPADGWVADWDDVLRRAGEPHVTTRRPHRQGFTRRRPVLALAVVVAAVTIPLAALAAANDWWFFRFGAAPAPARAPVVVRKGEWDGQPWQLIAYPSTTDGVCFAVTAASSNSGGPGAAMTCAPIAGIARTPSTKPSPDMTITYLSGSASDRLPAYIAGPVVASASEIEVQLGNGEALRAPTFAAPRSVGDVRFYAAQLPSGAKAAQPEQLTGLDERGEVVACLVPQTAVDGVSPLSDCR